MVSKKKSWKNMDKDKIIIFLISIILLLVIFIVLMLVFGNNPVETTGAGDVIVQLG